MKKFSFLIFFILLVIIFRFWFSNALIGGFDTPIYTPLMYNNNFLYPYAWNGYISNGLGNFNSPFDWVVIFYQLPIAFLGQFLHLPWFLIERISYFYPFLFLTSFSSFFLFRSLFKEKALAIFASGIFLFNTYILMVVGGQIEIAISIGFSPLVVALFIKLIEDYKNKLRILITSLVLSFQMLIDPRPAFVALIGVIIYFFIKNIIGFKNSRAFYLQLFKSFILVFVIPGLISFLLHSFWLLPTLLNHKNPLNQLGSAYTTSNAVNYFSFAKLEDSVSLLHPNWPENIFGKVYFMRPEFIFIPVMAYVSLFFINKLKEKKQKIYILYFALLGLIGAFLSKGSNEPLGLIFLWMFNHLPGFQLFRDPTKWYLFVAMSYSVLIPFSIKEIYKVIKSKSEYFKLSLDIFLPNFFLILITAYFLFLLKPALFGELRGNFIPVDIPQNYKELNSFLYSQNFSRTLWFPTFQRFGLASPAHPLLLAQDFFHTTDFSMLITNLASSEALLQNSSIKYVIIPEDSEGEIFLKERKYDNNLYLKTLSEVSKINYLKKVESFGKIIVFQVPNAKDHFWTSSKDLKLSYRYISPVEYIVKVENAKKGDLIVFSENFDAKWFARSSNNSLDLANLIPSDPFDRRFNSFVLRKSGNYSLDIYYYPQVYVDFGIVVSLFTLSGSFVYLIYLYKKR